MPLLHKVIEKVKKNSISNQFLLTKKVTWQVIEAFTWCGPAAFSIHCWRWRRSHASTLTIYQCSVNLLHFPSITLSPKLISYDIGDDLLTLCDVQERFCGLETVTEPPLISGKHKGAKKPSQYKVALRKMIKIFVMCQPSLRPFLHGWRKAVWCARPCGLLHFSRPSVNLTPKLALLIPPPCGGKQGPRCQYLGLRGWRRTIACWAGAPWAGLKQSNPLCSETGEQQHSCPGLHKQCFPSVGNLRVTRFALHCSVTQELRTASQL